MTTTPAPAIADVENKTVTFEGTTYDIQALAEDNYTVLVKGIPQGRIVYSFGAPNGVPEGDSGTSEDTLWYIGEAWFKATIAELPAPRGSDASTRRPSGEPTQTVTCLAATILRSRRPFPAWRATPPAARTSRASTTSTQTPSPRRAPPSTDTDRSG
jgi:hypothetical protein